jgi:hypothetical protein
MFVHSVLKNSGNSFMGLVILKITLGLGSFCYYLGSKEIGGRDMILEQ